MALIDEIKGKAGDVYQVAGKKVGEAYSITKVKLAIADKQNTLRALYKELGELTYASYKKEVDNAEEVEDKIAEIDLVAEGIEELKKQYRQIKNIVLCPACNAEISGDSNFCPKCGQEL